MRTKAPVLNAVNFAAIFTILYFLDVITSYLHILIALGVGLVIGAIIDLIYSNTHKHDKPKPLTIVLIALVAILSISLLIATNFVPINLSGHTIAQEEETQTEEVIVEEKVEYNGICEQEQIVKIYDPDAKDYYSDWEWNELTYDCNTKEDCITQLTEKGREFEENRIRCSLE